MLDSVQGPQRLFVEWAPKVNQRAGLMVPVADLAYILGREDPGFRSVYEFEEDDARRIQQGKRSKGFSKYPVHSSTLFVDMDHGDEGIMQIRAKLDSMDAQYSLYESGGKGAHFEIDIEPMEGSDVPYSQYAFAKMELSTLVDSSIFRPNSLIALPGRLHAITGRPKRLLGRSEGEARIRIPLRPAPPVYHSEVPLRAMTPAAWQFALQKAAKLLQKPPQVGERHQRLWSTALTLAEAGMSRHTATELILTAGRFLGKDDEDIHRAIDDAFKEIED